MLQAHGQQPLQLAFDQGTVAVLRAHPHPCGALHFFIDCRHRKAALFHDFHAIAPQDFRIDEGFGLIPALTDVDDDDSLVHIHLGGGQSDTGCRIHGLEHVVDQLRQCGVKPGDRGRAGTQPRVRKLQNRQVGHGFCVQIPIMFRLES